MILQYQINIKENKFVQMMFIKKEHSENEKQNDNKKSTSVDNQLMLSDYESSAVANTCSLVVSRFRSN